jgi:hypothetical protein
MPCATIAVMAVFHRATITPTKDELIGSWAPTQPWGPPAEQPVALLATVTEG